VSRFCLGAHTLAVKSSVWRGGNGHCDKCICAAVHNEVHHDVLFHCQDLSVCSLGKRYSFLISLSAIGLLYFACLAKSDCLWFPFSEKHRWVSSTANSAIHLGHYGLFFGWWKQQQTNQPNDQAGSY